MDEQDDIELLDAWREGDARAGDALFRRHFARIYRFFRSKTPDAEDLTQRTFLALVENRQVMRPDSNFRAYAFGIARNQLLMHYRKRGNSLETSPQTHSAADLAGPGLETGLRKGEELRLVLRAMQQLPLDFQVALELYYWEDMSVGDIATALELPAGTIKSRLWRGRELLREQIEQIDAPGTLRESTLGQLNRWIGLLRENIEGSQ